VDVSGLRVNGARLRESLERMAQIGATPAGGVQRLALSDEDKGARDLLIAWFQEIGLEVAVDEMGSIFGRRRGRDDDEPPVMMGSHVDSQPKGGRFDGILGVMGALEVLRTLAEHDVRTRRPLVSVDWTNEEGSRFAPAMMASGVWSGRLDRDWVWARTDLAGATVLGELERIGYRGGEPCVSRPFAAYYELHIEQGPRLDRERVTIGVPKGILGIHWYDVDVDGQANQVGPTPMSGRADALVAAAEMIVLVRDMTSRVGGDLVATVGEIHNAPNSRNVIPGHVHFTVDIRSWDDELALRAWTELRDGFESLAGAHGCAIRVEETWQVQHVEFAPHLVQRVESCAQALGHSTLPMVSGAGHDASYMALTGPTAMVFVPSIDGRSHVEVEDTRWEDCEAGANVLLQCVARSAEE
jgi:beta-ureidopropionase / N-carbamoyl-L-amino-acid hydrolase